MKAVSVALDGKTIRSTGKVNRYESPLHIVSAQLCETGITLASRSADGKSNEIPAVQELLKELDIVHGGGRRAELSEKDGKSSG